MFPWPRVAWVGFVVLGASCVQVTGLAELTFGGAGTAGGGGGAGGEAEGGAGGAPPVGDVVFHDDTFEGGSFDGVELSDEGYLVLESGVSSGTFTSRVFDASVTVTWTSLSWDPGEPYGKPLPDGGAEESGYRSGNIAMTENLLLLHLDGNVGAVAMGTVFDASPKVQTVEVLNPMNDAAFIEGVFGSALDDSDTSGLRMVVSDASGIRFGDSDYTFAIWARMSGDCEWPNKVFMGTEENDIMDRDHLWLGCTAATNCSPAGVLDEGRLGGTHHSTDSDVFMGSCGPKRINDGSWHHVAVTKTGASTTFPQPVELHYYVDGREDSVRTGIFEAPIVLEVGPPYFTIGTFPTASDEFQADADFDEAVVFSRALSASEVAGLHARGAFRLEIRVRACATATCSDDPPWQIAQVDPAGELSPPSGLALDGVPGASFVQYEAAFESLDLTLEGPKLHSVTIAGQSG